MVAITISPAVPLPGQTVYLYATGTTGNLLEFAVDSAPSGSAFLSGRIPNYAQTFVPDVAGNYSISVSDITRNYATPGYTGDPAARATITLNSITTGQVVAIGQKLTRTLGADPDLVDCTVLVLGSTVIGAMLVNPRTRAADLASQDSGVLLALNACTNVSAASLDDTLQTKANRLRTAFEAHRVLVAGTVHAAGDPSNAITKNLAVNTDEGALALLADIRTKLSQHMINQILSGYVNPHVNPGVSSVIRVAGATDKRSGHALADNMWSVYETHRVTVAGTPGNVHGAADNTNTLAAQAPLAALQSAFITAAYNASLSTPLGQSTAAVVLINAHGFHP